MQGNYTWKFVVGTPRIHDIQGLAHISLYNGLAVSSVPGIVTAKRSTGFYMEDTFANWDANDSTSEGIFVFTSSAPTVSVGDAVSVTATVNEFHASSTNLSTTELDSPIIVVLSSGNPLPPAVVIGTGGRIPPNMVIEDDVLGGNIETSNTFDPASDGIDFYESLEGMLVQLNNAVVVGPTATFGGATPNHEIPVLGDNGTNAGVRTVRGGVIVRANDFNPERIILNDQITGGPTLLSATVNDTFPGAIVGVMDYNFGNFKLQVTALPAVVSGGLAQEVTSAPSSNQLVVAAYNVENLSMTDTVRINQLAGLIVNNLRSPDLFSMEEIQDDSGYTNDNNVASIGTINAITNAIITAGGPLYQYREIDPVNNQDGGAPGANIRQIFLFRTDRGLIFIDRPGGTATTGTGVVNNGGVPNLQFSPGRIDPTNSAFNSSRKPLAGEFSFQGHHLFAVANHFNSKGGDQPLFGHFQPPTLSSETQRVNQATIVNNFVQQILTIDPNADVVVMGDLNDFEFSNPIMTLKGSILFDLAESFLPQNERYTYEFDGNAQALDHILVTSHLSATASLDVDIVHFDAEYNPLTRESDHDVPLVRMYTAPTAVTISNVEAHAATLDERSEGAMPLLMVAALVGMSGCSLIWIRRKRRSG